MNEQLICTSCGDKREFIRPFCISCRKPFILPCPSCDAKDKRIAALEEKARGFEWENTAIKRAIRNVLAENMRKAVDTEAGIIIQGGGR